MSKLHKHTVDQGHNFFRDILQEMPKFWKIPLSELTAEHIYLLQRLTTSSIYDVVRISIARENSSGRLIAKDYSPLYSFCEPEILHEHPDPAIYIRDEICPRFAVEQIRLFLRSYDSFEYSHSISVIDAKKSLGHEELDYEKDMISRSYERYMKATGLHCFKIPEEISQNSIYENKWQKKYRKCLTEMYILRRQS